jgi:DNA-binding Xre family transcriptional regulator
MGRSGVLTVSQRQDMIESMDNFFVDQLRSAIRESKMSLGSIAQSTAIDKAVLSRFMNGKSGLSVTSIDRLCIVLGLRLVSETELSKQRKRRK